MEPHWDLHAFKTRKLIPLNIFSIISVETEDKLKNRFSQWVLKRFVYVVIF